MCVWRGINVVSIQPLRVRLGCGNTTKYDNSTCFNLQIVSVAGSDKMSALLAIRTLYSPSSEESTESTVSVSDIVPEYVFGVSAMAAPSFIHW